MSEINETLSIWAKLYKKWEKMESDLRSNGGAPPDSEVCTHMSAMEVELRALGAKVDTAFNDATRAIHKKAGAEIQSERNDLG